MIKAVRSLLAHPDLRDLDIDDPRTTERRRDIIRKNTFLTQIYDEWYRLLCSCIPQGDGAVLELGSGAGFLSNYIPDLITSEVFPCTDIRCVLDARHLPFLSHSLRSVAMVDVLHHIPDCRKFFVEATRCLRSGGSLVMIEPWVSTWSKQIYTHLHHEPFEWNSSDWSFPEAGPLSGANGALPWIIFHRDHSQFESGFRELRIETIQPLMPFRYLISGGVSMRQLMPGFSFQIWKKAEAALSRWPQHWSMFALIHLRRL